jgi:hypothetical protein
LFTRAATDARLRRNPNIVQRRPAPVRYGPGTPGLSAAAWSAQVRVPGRTPRRWEPVNWWSAGTPISRSPASLARRYWVSSAVQPHPDQAARSRRLSVDVDTVPHVAFDAHALLILIASPGDTREERDAVERALHGWNADRAEREQVVLLPQRWETSAVPRLGGRAQSITGARLVLGGTDATGRRLCAGGSASRVQADTRAAGAARHLREP